MCRATPTIRLPSTMGARCKSVPQPSSTIATPSIMARRVRVVTFAARYSSSRRGVTTRACEHALALLEEHQSGHEEEGGGEPVQEQERGQRDAYAVGRQLREDRDPDRRHEGAGHVEAVAELEPHVVAQRGDEAPHARLRPVTSMKTCSRVVSRVCRVSSLRSRSRRRNPASSPRPSRSNSKRSIPPSAATSTRTRRRP